MNELDRSGTQGAMPYGIAVLAVALSAMLFMALEALTQSHYASIFVPAVLVSLLYGGVGPGYLAATLSTAATAYFLFSAATPATSDSIWRLILSAAVLYVMCVLIQTREKRIRGSIASLSDAMSAAVDGIVRLNPNGRIAQASDSFAQLVGSSVLGLKNRPIVELVVQDDRNQVVQAARHCWSQGRSDIDVRILWKGAAPHDVHMMLSRAEDLDGRPAGIYCFVKDITQRKQELEQLRQSQERMEVAFRHGIVCMAVTDLQGNLLEINPAFCEMLGGYQPEELLGASHRVVTHADDLARDTEAVRQLASGAADHSVIEKRYLRRDGSTVLVRVSREVVHDSEGKPAYLLVQAREISSGD